MPPKRLNPRGAVDHFHFFFLGKRMVFDALVQLFQSSSSNASISSLVISDSNLPVYFNNSAWLWRRFISSSAFTMASRLVLALVCRIASRNILSGILTVVFMQHFCSNWNPRQFRATEMSIPILSQVESAHSANRHVRAPVHRHPV